MKEENEEELIYFVKVKAYKQDMPHYFYFLPPMHLTTDNKKHPHLSWAQIGHLFLAIRSGISFYLWMQLFPENYSFLIKEPGQADESFLLHSSCLGQASHRLQF